MSDNDQPFYPLPDQDHSIQNIKLQGKKITGGNSFSNSKKKLKVTEPPKHSKSIKKFPPPQISTPTSDLHAPSNKYVNEVEDSRRSISSSLMDSS